jgi:hypothetical protein
VYLIFSSIGMLIENSVYNTYYSFASALGQGNYCIYWINAVMYSGTVLGLFNAVMYSGTVLDWFNAGTHPGTVLD